MFIETKGLRIFIYQEPIDMRCGFERLCYLVREIMKNNINQGHLYLFLGKNRRRLKALFFDGTGLVLTSSTDWKNHSVGLRNILLSGGSQG